MTDSTMVEKVAEAIWQAEWARAGNRGARRIPWTDNSPEHMERYRFLARAAIEAMMEPTTAMLKAGDIPGWDDSVTVDLAGEIWQAMLSEALRSSLKGEGE